MNRPRLWPAVMTGWAIAAIVLTLVSARAIAHLWFPDVDDAMRLLEVRDWLGGQSWWDVGQHRLNHGDFPMHWSRLVDLPLAAVMLLFDPLVGQAASTRTALTVVPLLTLLAVMSLGAALTRQVATIDVARRAVLLAPLSVPLIYQMRPMRIDHHGWQVALALAAILALVCATSRRSGIAAGLALAVLLTVSLEGLPITAAVAAVALLAALLDARRRGQALALLWTLFLGAALLQAATRGPGMFAPACDAMAPGWIAALGVAALGCSAALLLPLALAPWLRLAGVAAAGGAALAVLRLIAPACLGGPFAGLDPLVYRFWYRNVSEGLPIWDQDPLWAIMTVSFPLVGFAGTVLALRAADPAGKARWAMVLALSVAAFALSVLVMRSGATANALALPGAAWLLDAMLVRARRIPSVLARTGATAGAFLAATPGLAAAALFGAPVATAGPISAAPVAIARPSCDHGHEMADLAVLPPATLFAPLDVTPQLLAWTPHRAIASGYHRNVGAIHAVLATFLGDPENAEREVRRSGAAYVVGCPGENETELYKTAAPNGFWARLERGERFDWLQPVAMPGSPVLAWRVVAPPVAAAPSKVLSGSAPRS